MRTVKKKEVKMILPVGQVAAKIALSQSKMIAPVEHKYITKTSFIN